MRGTAIRLNFIWGNGLCQLVIPVYQRNYAWKLENCNQLFADLVKLKNSNRSSHFFGSIVTAPSGPGYDRLIIDGQQRLTTTSLLMLAAIQAVKDGKMECYNKDLLKVTHDTMLWSEHGSHPACKFKLVPIENDREAYGRLFEGDETKYIANSKITRNFKFFYDKLTASPAPFKFDELHQVVERLNIICIDLDYDDDPQLIFESLNSTGLALEEADKIRNYLLMSLSPIEQENCYLEYWKKIQDATNDTPTPFLRDYMTICNNMQRPVRYDQLYFTWKKYMDGRNRKEELSSMLDYVRYYKMASSGEVSISIDGALVHSKQLTKKMRQLCNLDTDVINVFLTSFFKYAVVTKMTEDEVWRVLDVIECFIARRIICSMPSNALTQTFCVLHRDVLRSISEYEEAGLPVPGSYADILIYHILRREGNFRIPRDQAFADAIATRDAYHMPKPAQRFLFERLENFKHTEFNDINRLMSDGEATIEHIMPQTLNQEWKSMLGIDAEEVHEKYLHTFANLTLTGVNSELSNNAFDDKKNGKMVKGVFVNGYRGSKYRLTQEIVSYDTWTETDMLHRAKVIHDKFFALYPLPTTSFKPLPKAVEEIQLGDESFHPTNRRIRGFRILGQDYEENYWIDFMIRVIRILLQRYPDGVDAFADRDNWLHHKMTEAPKNYAKVAEEYYLWKAMNNETKLSVLRDIFDVVEVPHSELTLLIEPLKKESDNQEGKDLSDDIQAQ